MYSKPKSLLDTSNMDARTASRLKYGLSTLSSKSYFSFRTFSATNRQSQGSIDALSPKSNLCSLTYASKASRSSLADTFARSHTFSSSSITASGVLAIRSTHWYAAKEEYPCNAACLWRSCRIFLPMEMLSRSGLSWPRFVHASQASWRNARLGQYMRNGSTNDRLNVMTCSSSPVLLRSAAACLAASTSEVGQPSRSLEVTTISYVDSSFMMFCWNCVVSVASSALIDAYSSCCSPSK
mmetsp:Transcript_22254/g.63103  ORF Transcript_22254/g.63103 Transcript_22254/m.63103 type:complete len:239 (+) Transcript_22254:382-1098(+)